MILALLDLHLSTLMTTDLTVPQRGIVKLIYSSRYATNNYIFHNLLMHDRTHHLAQLGVLPSEGDITHGRTHHLIQLGVLPPVAAGSAGRALAGHMTLGRRSALAGHVTLGVAGGGALGGVLVLASLAVLAGDRLQGRDALAALPLGLRLHISLPTV